MCACLFFIFASVCKTFLPISTVICSNVNVWYRINYTYFPSLDFTGVFCPFLIAFMMVTSPSILDFAAASFSSLLNCPMAPSTSMFYFAASSYLISNEHAVTLPSRCNFALSFLSLMSLDCFSHICLPCFLQRCIFLSRYGLPSYWRQYFLLHCLPCPVLIAAGLISVNF